MTALDYAAIWLALAIAVALGLLMEWAIVAPLH